jgi:hypothetical protein
MTRSIFFGFGAFVGSIKGATQCAFWPGDPASFKWASSAQIEVDLAMNPQLARGGKITPADIVVDDYAGYAVSGQTTIGPMWPGGTMNGTCWLESMFWENLAKTGNQPPRLPADAQCHDYELCNVLYWDGPLAQRRFQGLYATIQAEKGSLALCTVWQPGTSQIPGQNPLGTWWLDLDKLAHPIEKGFTEIGVGAGVPKQGALFLDIAARTIVPFDTPKNPRPMGGIVPGGRRVR